MRHAFLSVSLLAFASVCSVQAAVTSVSDIRLTLGTVLSDGTEFESQGSGTKLDTELDESARLGLRHVRSIDPLGSRGGVIWGAGLFINSQEGEISNSTTTIAMDVFGVEGMIGYGLPIANLPLHIEAGIVASAGTADVTFKSAGSDTSNSGGYWDIGLEAGAYFAVSQHWVLGLDFRYIFVGETTYHNGPTSIDITIANHLEVGASVGYRF